MENIICLMPYFVQTTETFDKEVKKKHRDRKEWLASIIEKLRENPQHGKPLTGRLHGIWQVRMGPFRIWYEINDIEKIVIMKAILHKDGAIERY